MPEPQENMADFLFGLQPDSQPDFCAGLRRTNRRAEIDILGVMLDLTSIQHKISSFSSLTQSRLHKRRQNHCRPHVI